MAPETLEVEDVEQRQRRLQDILERLDREGPATRASPDLYFDFGDRRTFAIEPPTELLARVRQFLPQIEQSNAELLQRHPQSIDIEHIEGTDERVIQMDLGLGVFEQRHTRRDSASSSFSGTSDSERGSRTTNVSSSALSASGSSSSSSSGSDSDPEDDGDRDSSSRHLRPIRSLPKRARPIIQILASRDQDDAFAEGSLTP